MIEKLSNVEALHDFWWFTRFQDHLNSVDSDYKSPSWPTFSSTFTSSSSPYSPLTLPSLSIPSNNAKVLTSDDKVHNKGDDDGNNASSLPQPDQR